MPSDGMPRHCDPQSLIHWGMGGPAAVSGLLGRMPTGAAPLLCSEAALSSGDLGRLAE